VSFERVYALVDALKGANLKNRGFDIEHLGGEFRPLYQAVEGRLLLFEEKNEYEVFAEDLGADMEPWVGASELKDLKTLVAGWWRENKEEGEDLSLEYESAGERQFDVTLRLNLIERVYVTEDPNGAVDINGVKYSYGAPPVELVSI